MLGDDDIEIEDDIDDEIDDVDAGNDSDVDCAGKPWTSWASLGLKVADEKHEVEWRNCTDINHAWTGLVRLKPGQTEPMHRHTLPMFYYILQVCTRN